MNGAVELANCVVEDNDEVNQAISHFASLGANNRCPSNNERDLFRWLGSMFGLRLRPYTIVINLQAFQSGLLFPEI